MSDLDETAIKDPMLLARRHTLRAIERLAELMECDGRQAMVAAVACKTMIEVAYPDMDAERVRKLVEEKLAAVLEEARQRRLVPPPSAG